VLCERMGGNVEIDGLPTASAPTLLEGHRECARLRQVNREIKRARFGLSPELPQDFILLDHGEYPGDDQPARNHECDDFSGGFFLLHFGSGLL